jgi:hypothetical protein
MAVESQIPLLLKSIDPGGFRSHGIAYMAPEMLAKNLGSCKTQRFFVKTRNLNFWSCARWATVGRTRRKDTIEGAPRDPENIFGRRWN